MFWLALAAATLIVVAGCGEQTKLRSHPLNSPTAGSEATRRPGQPTIVNVTGILDPSGDRLITLDSPVRRVARGEVPPPTEGRYRLEVVYETGERLVIPFDGLVSDDAGHTQHGFFEIAVPEDQPINTMTIFDTFTRRVLATMRGADIVD